MKASSNTQSQTKYCPSRSVCIQLHTQMKVQEIWSGYHRSWERGETAEALLLQFSFAEHCKYRMLKEKLIRGQLLAEEAHIYQQFQLELGTALTKATANVRIKKVS